ncbi:unnamed protein product [Oncorhynchus mykiss]|uniref:PH domain-containing protein n=1 Tax=Oncorhynchus mykiss TaxID=8022 RepID=A0A060XWH0_ONCMY|nr:unnamed protein product [Oncorhynchus mykiss]
MVDRLANSEANSKRIQVVEGCFGAAGQPLVIPGRVLIGEGVLTKLCRKKPKARQFFLFNDILVYGNIVIQKKKYNKQHIIPLESVTIDTVADEGDLRNGWLIKTPPSPSLSTPPLLLRSQTTSASAWATCWRRAARHRLASTPPSGYQTQRPPSACAARRSSSRPSAAATTAASAVMWFVARALTRSSCCPASHPSRCVCVSSLASAGGGMGLGPRSDSYSRSGSKFNNVSDDEDEEDSSD